MKKYIPHIVAFAVGALIASLVFLLIRANEKKIDENGVLLKTETIIERDTVYVSKDEMKTDELPKVEKEYVYVQLPPEAIEKVIHDTTYIYKDIPLQKQHYHTKANDVEIWHSGIQSSIDSLINVRETKIVNKIYAKQYQHEVSVYGNMGYSNRFVSPVGIKYLYFPKQWIGIGVRAERDLINRQNAIMAEVDLSFKF